MAEFLRQALTRLLFRNAPGDMSRRELRRLIHRLDPNQPIVSNFEAAIVARRGRSEDRWYGNQQQHWLGWLRGYNGPGYYGRKNWSVPAGTVYSRVVNPSMVLWLGAAAGVHSETVQDAANAALDAPDRMESQSAAIRRVMPWPVVESALRAGNK